MSKMNPNELTAAYALQAQDLCRSIDHVAYAVGADGDGSMDLGAAAGGALSDPGASAGADVSGGAKTTGSDAGAWGGIIQAGTSAIQAGTQAVKTAQGAGGGTPAAGPVLLYVDGRTKISDEAHKARANQSVTVYYRPKGAAHTDKNKAATGKWSSDGKYFTPDTYSPDMAGAAFSVGVRTGKPQANQNLQALINQLGAKYGIKR